MEKIYNPILENLALESVNSFFSKVRELGKSQEKIVVGLSGGSSLDAFYEQLKEFAKYLEQEYWEKVEFCLLDERVVPQDYKDANQKQLKQKCLTYLEEERFISEKQLIFPKYYEEESQMAQEYSKRVSKIDIGLFGCGPDGHIASLFPKHRLLEEENTNFLFLNDSPKAPKKRITLSSKMIETMAYAFLFIIGEDKQPVLDKLLDKTVSSTQCPAKLILTAKHSELITTQS